MKNKTTELVFILDRSGSMHGLENDTIGGFNGFLKQQKQNKDACFVTTVLFDHEIMTLHDRIPLKKMKPMTPKDYTVRGTTALIDAIGSTINHISRVHRYIRKEDVPSTTTFVIITDGLENASRKFSSDEVKQMIAQKKEEGWDFLFLGANIDAVETASHFGIDEDRVANYHADHKGTQVVYASLSKAILKQREEGCPMAASWNDDINEDFYNRS